MSWVKRLRADHWAWIHAKLALIFWGVLYAIYTPEGPLKELGKTLNVLIAGFTIVGSVMAILGLIISTNIKLRKQGLILELAGLIIAGCGPLTYFITQASLIQNNQARIALSGFAYSLTGFVVARAIVVARALRRLN